MPTDGPAPGEPTVVAVVGPTASGKSELALRICETLGGEAVNADAMQLYRGMDVGTAKLTLGERRGIPHHQLDVLEVTEEASVAAYQQAARRDIAEIRASRLHPVLVGGSGLYVRAALDRLEIPPTDAATRARWERRAEEEGTPALYARLQQQDPRAAAAIEVGNTRRIVRALEVIELTGRPFSATLPTREHVTATVMVGLLPPRASLDRLIGERVTRMWRGGMLDEVRALDRCGLRRGRTASRALGYAQALAQLDGRLSEDDAISETAAATRRFARRQESWFRPDPRITWFDPFAHDGLDAALVHVRRSVSGADQRGRDIRDNGAHD